jgi:hypothetical protein
MTNYSDFFTIGGPSVDTGALSNSSGTSPDGQFTNFGNTLKTIMNDISQAIPGNGQQLSSPVYSHSQGDTSERLFRVLPRYADAQYNAERGQRATMFLLSQDPVRSKSRPVDGDAQAVLDNNMDKLLDPNRGFTDFLVTGMRVSFDEKVQVTPVFGDTEIIYYFGRQPIQFDISGLLIDDLQNSWFTQFMQLYSNVFRGSELARNAELIRLDMPSMSIIGSISSFAFDQNSARDTDIQFQMRFIARKIKPLAGAIPGIPLSADASLIDFNAASGFSNFTDMTGINGIKNNINTLAGVINGTATVSQGFNALLGLGSMAASVNNLALQGKSAAASISGLFSKQGLGGSPYATISGLINGQLNGFRGSLFSPVYGFLSSITRVVQGNGGNLSTIFSGLPGSVNTALRDVVNISSQAQGLVGMLAGGPETSAAKSSLIAMSNSTGVLSQYPSTLAHQVGSMSSQGQINPASIGASLTSSSYA